MAERSGTGTPSLLSLPHEVLVATLEASLPIEHNWHEPEYHWTDRKCRQRRRLQLALVCRAFYQACADIDRALLHVPLHEADGPHRLLDRDAGLTGSVRYLAVEMSEEDWVSFEEEPEYDLPPSSAFDTQRLVRRFTAVEELEVYMMDAFDVDQATGCTMLLNWWRELKWLPKLLSIRLAGLRSSDPPVSRWAVLRVLAAAPALQFIEISTPLTAVEDDDPVLVPFSDLQGAAIDDLSLLPKFTHPQTPAVDEPFVPLHLELHNVAFDCDERVGGRLLPMEDEAAADECFASLAWANDLVVKYWSTYNCFMPRIEVPNLDRFCVIEFGDIDKEGVEGIWALMSQLRWFEYRGTSFEGIRLRQRNQPDILGFTAFMAIVDALRPETSLHLPEMACVTAEEQLTLEAWCTRQTQRSRSEQRVEVRLGRERWQQRVIAESRAKTEKDIAHEAAEYAKGIVMP